MIYFLRQLTTGYIKIGSSSNVFTRMSDLQTQVKSPVVLIGVMEGWYKEEAKLHQSLEVYRLSHHIQMPDCYGYEWYYPTPKIMDILTSLVDVNVIRRLMRSSDNRPFGYLRREKTDWLIPTPHTLYRGETSHERALQRYDRMRAWDLKWRDEE